MVPGLPGAKNTRFSREPPGSLRPPIGLRGHQDPPGSPPAPTRDPDAAVGHKGHIWRQRWGTPGTFGGAACAVGERAQRGGGAPHQGNIFRDNGRSRRTGARHGGHKWRAQRAQLAGKAGEVGGDQGSRVEARGVLGRGFWGARGRLWGFPEGSSGVSGAPGGL